MNVCGDMLLFYVKAEQGSDPIYALKRSRGQTPFVR